MQFQFGNEVHFMSFTAIIIVARNVTRDRIFTAEPLRLSCQIPALHIPP